MDAAQYLRKSRMEEGMDTEEVLAKHRKALADFAAAHEKHKEMGCICYENPAMGIYFIQDPDGYWLEIVPTRK